MNKLNWLLSLITAANSTFAGKIFYESTFAENNWDQSLWQEYKSWRWQKSCGWQQRDNHIENTTPSDATQEEMQGKRAADAYSTLLLKSPLPTDKLTVTSEMEFDYRMAPGLIFTITSPERISDGRMELREHLEIILFDEGINIWHHFFENGKQKYKLAGFLRTPFAPKTRCRIVAEFDKFSYGQMLTVQVGEHRFGCLLPELPEKIQAGIVGCEGINRFYDFGAFSR